MTKSSLQAKMARTVLLTTDWKAMDTGAVNNQLLDNIGPKASTGTKVLISILLFFLLPGFGFILCPLYIIWAFFGGKEGNGITTPSTQNMSPENAAKVSDLHAKLEIAELEAKLNELKNR